MVVLKHSVSRFTQFLGYSADSLQDILAKRLEGIMVNGRPIVDTRKFAYVARTVRTMPHTVRKL